MPNSPVPANRSSLSSDGARKVNHMSKPKSTDLSVASAARELDGVRKAASLAGRAMQRLEAEAERIAGEVGMSGRSLRLVSAGEQFSALIRHGKTTIQIEGDAFAITQGE